METKLKHFPTYTIQQREGVFIAKIYNEFDGSLFCDVIGDSKRDADCKAMEIVKKFNANYELMEVAIECLKWCNGVQSPEFVNQLRARVENVIKKAKP